MKDFTEEKVFQHIVMWTKVTLDPQIVNELKEQWKESP